MCLRKKIFLLLFSSFLAFPSFAAVEDFTSGWSKGGANSSVVDMGVTDPNQLIISVCEDRDEAYVIKDQGAGGIAASFTHTWDFYPDVMDDGQNDALIWSISDTAGPTFQALTNATDGVGVSIDDWGGIASSWSISIWDFENSTEDDVWSFNTAIDTWKYLTMVRSNSTFTLYVFSDAARTNLLYTLTATVSADTFRYQSFFGSQDIVADETADWSGKIDNADLSGSSPSWTTGEWGAHYTAGDTANFAFCRCMGGTSPNIANMKITGIGITGSDTSGASNVRLAVYTGGAAADPNGATLLTDIGVVDGDGFGADNHYTLGTSVDWPAATLTWVCIKDNDTDFGFSHYSTVVGAGDFQTARGRWNNATESTDETNAFDATIDSTGGAFANIWYGYWLTYEITSVSEKKIFTCF